MLDFAKDKKFWDYVRESEDFARHRKEIKEKYDWAFEGKPQLMTYGTYFGKGDQGNIWYRQLFQLQSAALMSMIYYDNEEYFNNLIEIIWVYCGEYSWSPLAHHNSYYNTTPDEYDPALIDIYAASIGFSMAEIKHLLADRLPKLIQDRMSDQIRRRIIDPYINKRFFWEKHDNNWNAVCTGAVGGTLMYEAPDVFNANKDRLRKSVDFYLAPYADDGVCVEGTAYWGFGFGFFAIYASLLKEFTNGEDDLFKLPKVKSIAEFVQKTFMDTHTMVTFSDCNLKEGYWIGLPHLLRSVYGESIDKLPSEQGTIIAYQHFAFALRSILYYKKEFTADDKLKPAIYNLTDTGWFIKRGEHYGIALKGGTNGESHNHNDVGSFILSHKNKQVFVDLGSGAYSQDYHGEKRYTFFHPSSWSHNVPYFGDKPQDGEKRERVIIDYDEATKTAKYEFANAYGLDSVRKIERSFVLEENEITLTDRYDTDKGVPITERFVTRHKPTVWHSSVIVCGVKLRPKDKIAPKITVVDAPCHTSDKTEKVYCIDYTLPEGTDTFEAVIEFNKI
ncbi:MAG: heparinase II/III family protein [Clostridia bacterium]|nr:heparinase II/III family protein [Clostridia bacterium]